MLLFHNNKYCVDHLSRRHAGYVQKIMKLNYVTLILENVQTVLNDKTDREKDHDTWNSECPCFKAVVAAIRKRVQYA